MERSVVLCVCVSVVAVRLSDTYVDMESVHKRQARAVERRTTRRLT